MSWSWLSRTDWTIRLLKLPPGEEAKTASGLVMIQIDGLSQDEFHQALERGSMPFLKSLCLRERYAVHPLYSGLPSNTPAFQAELFYGVKGGVPAFCFRDSQSKAVVKMFSPGSAAAVEEQLTQQGSQPLLEGGSAYSNIFTGGAEEAHFCAAKLGFGEFAHLRKWLVLPLLLLLHLDLVVRVGLLLAGELLLAIPSSIMGGLKGKSFFKELVFIGARLMMVVFLRELITRRAQIDIARGLPIMHLNFVGYDDHAHRRGPRSGFARWPLRGIDAAIYRLWQSARKSRRRHYDVWVYSDHGQEGSKSYPETVEGVSLIDMVKRQSADELAEPLVDYGDEEYPYRLDRTPAKADSGPPRVVVAAMGPVAHLYPPWEDLGRSISLARDMVGPGRIPAAAVPEKSGEVTFWTDDGPLKLPEDAAKLFGADHPFLPELTHDLLGLCRHPSAGAIILFGWRHGRQAVNFPNGYGAHAGFGPQETNGFALLPMDAPLPVRTKPYLRPLDLREGVLRFLGRSTEPPSEAATARPRAQGTLRIMTYNVHRCVGIDGKMSPERIARVIARHEPDIICLQELDEGLARTGRVKQAERIGQLLKMAYHFHPVIAVAQGERGNAILSRYPLRLIRAGQLPRLARYMEPRGAIWAAVDIAGRALQVINCHLSYWPYERAAQAAALLGGQWLADLLCQPPVILCGDFNALPGTGTYRLLAGALKDVHAQPTGIKSRIPRTWHSRYPVSRIDHVFTTPGIRVKKVTVPRTELDQLASDHLPLLAELEYA